MSSARVAEGRNRILRQELTESEESAHAGHVLMASVGELGAREQFKGFSLVRMGAESRDLVDTRWVLTWKGADGVKTAKARLVAKGYQDPDLRGGNVDFAGCVGRRSSHLRLISLGFRGGGRYGGWI